jgi:hypothetical protein
MYALNLFYKQIREKNEAPMSLKRRGHDLKHFGLAAMRGLLASAQGLCLGMHG